MKTKIVKTITTENILEFNNFTPLETKYYGIIDSFGEKGFVYFDRREREYMILACKNITVGNNYPASRGKNLKEILGDWINIDGGKKHQLFVFDNEKELFRWLGE